LLVRSVTRVDAALLARANRLRFVGSATIGCDHVDTALLAGRGIPFANAPGCNAPAVADYVMGAILLDAVTRGIDPAQRCYGVVGVGQIGSRVAARLRALGTTVLCCDPPRQAAGDAGVEHSLDELLARCDVITLHVPLTRHGTHATHHLLDARHLARLKPDMLLINAARGEVIDNRALLEVLRQRPAMRAMLDVWEEEPEPLAALVAHATLASPHVAGYSVEGKARGTWMLFAEASRILGWSSAPPAMESILPAPTVSRVVLRRLPDWSDLLGLTQLVYDLRGDDTRMRSQGLSAHGFDQLRRDYPPRREFSTLTVEAPAAALPLLSACGFGVAASA
jgi:erythronate-4-phosphate dehydrogenase